MKKSIQYVSNFLVAIVVLMVSFLLLIVYNSAQKIASSDKIASGYISKDAISFEVINAINISPSEVGQVLYSTNVLFQRNGNQLEDIIIWGISDHTTYELVSGRQLSKNDIDTDSPLIICGNKRLQDASSKYNHGSFVIGILGLDMPSLLDYMYIVLPPATERTFLSKGEWTIDGQHNVKASFDEFLKLVGSEDIRLIESKRPGTYRMTGENQPFERIIFCTFLCSLIAFSLIVYFWLFCRKPLWVIVNTIGIKNSRIITILTKEMVWIIASSSLCRVFLGTCITKGAGMVDKVGLSFVLSLGAALAFMIVFEVLLVIWNLCGRKELRLK